MIRSFGDKSTEAIFNGNCPRGFPADLFKVARRKLEAVHAATRLNDLAHREIDWSDFQVTGSDNTRSGSMTNGAFVSSGRTQPPNRSKSSIITDW
jgi:plasmid maintenance system killer protein